MQTAGVGLIVGVTGLLVGAISTNVFYSKKISEPVDNLRNELVTFNERMNRTEVLLREIKRNITSSETRLLGELSSNTGQPVPNVSSVDSDALPNPPQEVVEPDMAVENAIVENIIVRLYDPAYTNSTTMAEVMRSEEMIGLSDESRERVVREMVGMLNRGDISPETFFSNERH